MLPSTFVKKRGGTLSVMQIKHFIIKYSGVRYVYEKGSYKVKKENPEKKKSLPF